MTKQVSQYEQSKYDVTIMGGGMAGATLALQLKKSNSELSIAVIDANEFPVPEAKFKIGESTVDIAGHYLRNVLELKDHLENQQLPKYGLRFFLPNGDNSDISQRVEIGNCKRPNSKSYQIDRGLFENFLHDTLLENNVDFFDSSFVETISVANNEDNHQVVVSTKDNKTTEFSSRWLIDASGQAQLLKNQLELHETVQTDHFSVWFRVSEKVLINELSDEPEWLNRVSEAARDLCTNHLLGEGYWIWIIPLQNGNTSIGIVADAKIHSPKDMLSLPKALEWISEKEPQLGDRLKNCSATALDFKKMINFSHGCSQIFSENRWAITGIAGLFSDPFYSPGSDFIAIANTYITDLINRDLAKEDISDRLMRYEKSFYQGFHLLLNTVDGKYGLFAHNLATASKILWDATLAWSGLSLIFCNDKLTNFELIDAVGEDLFVIGQLHLTMQQVFTRWSNTLEDKGVNPSIIVDGTLNFTQRLQNRLPLDLSNDEIIAAIKSNRNVLCTLACELSSQVEQRDVEDSEVALLVSGFDYQPDIKDELSALLFQ
ncbi:NAD(P)/FAD-dependent oxidoreductase [Sessilibacter corallicola]|uniref:Tryptophan 7-halogenase n=1 Tax=Sessilibacter corallicola TaxID=2904075 RepID=A0ABQ0AB80_9GAMM